MYSLFYSLLGVPTNGANSTITYVCAVASLILLVVFIDMVYRLIRNICSRGRFD